MFADWQLITIKDTPHCSSKLPTTIMPPRMPFCSHYKGAVSQTITPFSPEPSERGQLKREVGTEGTVQESLSTFSPHSSSQIGKCLWKDF